MSIFEEYKEKTKVVYMNGKMVVAVCPPTLKSCLSAGRLETRLPSSP